MENLASTRPRSFQPLILLIATMASHALPLETPAPAGLDQNDIRVDLAEIPDALFSPDAPKQAGDALHGLGREDNNELHEEAERFSQRGAQGLRLEDMQRIYDQKQHAHSLDLLSKRIKVDWRNSDLVSQPRDLGSAVNWRATKLFIDMVVAIPRGIGLGAMLPHVINDLTWQFTLNVSINRARDFDVMHAKLGFNPSNRMLWVGKTCMGEDVWIAMIPNTFEADDAPVLDELEHAGKRCTHLEDLHRNILLVFLSYVLQEIGLSHIRLRKTYPKLDVDSLEASSDLL